MEVNCRTLSWSSLQKLQENVFVLILRSLGPTMWFARGFTCEDEVKWRQRSWKTHPNSPASQETFCLEKPEPFIACQAVNMYPCSAFWDFISCHSVCFSLFVCFWHRYVYCKQKTVIKMETNISASLSVIFGKLFKGFRIKKVWCHRRIFLSLTKNLWFFRKPSCALNKLETKTLIWRAYQDPPTQDSNVVKNRRWFIAELMSLLQRDSCSVIRHRLWPAVRLGRVADADKQQTVPPFKGHDAEMSDQI